MGKLQNCGEPFIVYTSKVYLGYKKTNPDKKYAIKVMKKLDMVNKNLCHQGWIIFFAIYNHGWKTTDSGVGLS